MHRHIPRATDSVIRTYLSLRRVAITGILGSGKTTCLRNDILSMAQGNGWQTCLIDRRSWSPVRIFEKIAREINATNFQKAFRIYKRQFKSVDAKIWLDNLKLIARFWEAAAMLITPAAPAVGLAMAVGSKALPLEQFVGLAETVATRTGKNLQMLTDDPLKFLAESLRSDLENVGRNQRTLVLLDDFEFLAPMLEEWLPRFVEASQWVTWMVAGWVEAPPYWFVSEDEDKEARIWKLDKTGLNEIDLAAIWYPDRSEDLDSPATTRTSATARLHFGGMVRVADDLGAPAPSGRSFDNFIRFQGPPTFGLPIFAPGFLGARESKGCWQPMLQHLKSWLEFDFPGRTQEVLGHLINCSVARYLDEGVVDRITGDPDLWPWLDRSPLLIEHEVCGERRRAFDFRLRCVLSYELYRKNRLHYHELHRDLAKHFKHLSRYSGTFKVEIWYHQLVCVRDYADLLPEILNRFLDGLWEASPETPADHVLGVLRDIGLENPNTLYLREWAEPAAGALDAYMCRESEEIPPAAEPLLSRIVDGGCLELLSKFNQERVRRDYNQYLKEKEEG